MRDGEDKKRRQEDEKRELERMEERKKKGLPHLKDGHLTGIISHRHIFVLTCYLNFLVIYFAVQPCGCWVGYLSMFVKEGDLSDNFGTYGEVCYDWCMFCLYLLCSYFLDCVYCPDPIEGVWVSVHEQEDRCQQGPEESEQI